MQSKHLNIISSCLAIFCLASCGGSEKKSIEEIAEDQSIAKNLQIENVLGFWNPVNSENYTFEFLGSDPESFGAVSVMAGKMYQDNQVVNNFTWSINDNGQINLNLKELSCFTRPLMDCPTKDSLVIQANGSDLKNAYWEINYDLENDGDIDNVLGDNYQIKRIDLSTMNQGNFYFVNVDEYFASNVYLGKNENGAIDLALVGNDVHVSASLNDTSISNLIFDNSESVQSTRTFDVFNVGYQNFTVETSYKNIALRASVDNSMSFYYEIHREIKVPAGINESALITDDFIKLEKRTVAVNHVDSLIDAPEINAGDKFYSYIYEVGGGTFGDETTNELHFSSSTEGVLIAEDVNKGKKTREISFLWQKLSDGSLLLDLSDGSAITISFLKETSGGYSALFLVENKDRTKRIYDVHDFTKDKGFEITEDMFPGRYQIYSNDSFSTVPVSFTADGKVNFANTDDLAGRWFINDEGELVSYECTDLAGNAITDYDRCLDSFEFIGTDGEYTDFSHIRRLKFLHRDGDDFVIKYNASFYGGPFNVVGATDYLTVNWTYRMKRIGDVRP